MGATNSSTSSSKSMTEQIPSTPTKQDLDILPNDFEVTPIRMPFASPTSILKITGENLALFDPDDNRLCKLFPFHKISMWSYSSEMFSWRVPIDSDDLNEESDSKSDESNVYTVLTSKGPMIDSTLMAKVTALMSQMSKRGVSDELFAKLVNTLHTLSDEGQADKCLEAVKQMAIGRAFHMKQAATLVNAIGVISPFEKVEAAVTLYPTLLSTEDVAFVSLLHDCFEDTVDRDNIAHRLGFHLSESGSLEKTHKKVERKV
jgi:hypothetical protein